MKISELPEAWWAKLPVAENARVIVPIEEETLDEAVEVPLFGMWRDPEDMADVEAYVGKLRAPRF